MKNLKQHSLKRFRMKTLAPSDPKSKQGAVVSKGHMEKVLSYIELAKEKGGKSYAKAKGGVTFSP